MLPTPFYPLYSRNRWKEVLYENSQTDGFRVYDAPAKKYRDFESFNINWVFVKEGKYLGDGKRYGGELISPLSWAMIGRRHMTAQDIHRKREIPESYKNAKVYLEIDFGGEALVVKRLWVLSAPR